MDSLKNTRCLEITSDYAKFAVGYMLNNQPVLVYYVKKPLTDCLVKGEIANPDSISKVIAQFLKIEDESVQLKISSTSVSIVVPPLGFQVYQNNKVTNVIASNGLIDKIDISNVMSLVKKEPVPNGNIIVDIVPDAFVLANGKPFGNPPLGEKSDSLSVEAKVHTLPENLLNEYRQVAEQAGFRIKRACIATYCASQLIACDKSMPFNYLYIDIGAHLTTVSLIGKCAPFGSLFFAEGGDELSKRIAEEFHISFKDANALKEKYGYDSRLQKRPLPLAKSVDEDGKEVTYYQRDLNSVIENYFDRYDSYLSNAIQTLSTRKMLNDSALSLPLVFGGGGSLLYGIDKLLVRSTGKRKAIYYVPSVMGARDPGAINILGLIAAEGAYRGTLEDDYHGVSTLSRDRTN
jgi:cell division protein FtsA